MGTLETNEHKKKNPFSTYQPEDIDSTALGLRPAPMGGWS